MIGSGGGPPLPSTSAARCLERAAGADLIGLTHREVPIVSPVDDAAGPGPVIENALTVITGIENTIDLGAERDAVIQRSSIFEDGWIEEAAGDAPVGAAR